MTAEARFSFSPEGAPGRPAGAKGGNLVLRGGLTAEIASQITDLDFNRVVLDHGSWEDLSVLRGRPVRSMLVRGVDLDWETINGLDQLVTLELETPAAVRIDSKLLNRLQYLAATWDGGAVDWLTESLSLKALNLYGGVPSLELLSGLRNLEALLVIKSTKLRSLDGIQRMNLSYAEFANCSKLSELADFSRCERLSCLNFESCKGLHSVSALASAPSLREVLIQIGEVQTLSTLSASTIEMLRFDCHVADGNLDFLFDMPRLQFCLFRDARRYSHRLAEIQLYLERKGFPQKALLESLSRFPAPRDFTQH